MIEPGNVVLSRMLERLFASMVSGPAMNCRPQASRQRIDFAHFARLKDVEPGTMLRQLLTADHAVKAMARVASPARAMARDDSDAANPLTPEERAARQSWTDQQSLVSKLRTIADDARTYEQDTGAHALNVGFPLLHLPPGTFGGRGGSVSRRLLAPIAFIPVSLAVKAGTKQGVEISCRGGGVDLVIPNLALLAWLEQQTGQPVASPFEDDEGSDPWKEIAGLVRLVSQRVGIEPPALFASDLLPESLTLAATPRADDEDQSRSILAAGVLGLFPTANQGLLNDTRDLIAGGAPDGPLDSFVRHGITLDDFRPHATASADEPATDAQPLSSSGAGQSRPAAPIPPRPAREFADERVIATADPCQARAVRLARQSRGLVIHGPPGTGKSQTITNVIGDHLARGQRVLFVCDKRTALDVVADRLRSLGLGDLCATVHDPQRDQRELYRSVREQLDNLPDAALQPDAPRKLERIDRELQLLHEELATHHELLMGRQGNVGSFHQLVGQWLGENGEVESGADWTALQALEAAEFERWSVRLKETLERGEAVNFARNPWRQICALPLARFLSNPMDRFRQAMALCETAAQEVDATHNPLHPPFPQPADLTVESQRRLAISDRLAALKTLPDAAAIHWAPQSAEQIASARSQLASAQSWISRLRDKPFDASLRAARMQLTDPDQQSAEQKALCKYATAFDQRAADLAAMKTACPTANAAALARWLGADDRRVTAARKRLEAADSLATAVDGTPLDPALLPRLEAAPLEPARRMEWLASLAAYLDIAGKWYAIFQPGRKKAAEPAVRHFGLSLTPDAAAKVRKFLDDHQRRLDLAAAITAATGEPVNPGATDEDLLAVYRENRALTTALAQSRAATTFESSAPSTPQIARMLNDVIGSDAAEAARILAAYGLPSDGSSASRVAAHLESLESATRLAVLLAKLSLNQDLSADTPAPILLKLAEQFEQLFALLTEETAQTPVGAAIRAAFAAPQLFDETVRALRESPKRAAAILAAGQAFSQSGMFRAEWLEKSDSLLRNSGLLGPTIDALARALDSLEGVLRIEQSLSELPAPLSRAATDLLLSSADAAAGFSAIRRNVLGGEIVRRLASTPELQTVDGHRLRSIFDRYRTLGEQKKLVVRGVIQDLWVSRQKERLLATTGSRLNGAGADLRRRLTSRGERAMRLRQVIAHGMEAEGGDPLFDLRPIWMASPETVAQLFPRKPMFDVVVFDEASQCRLEEALPVLTRAQRVVIAGDPRQLPPTRFFESAVSTSEDQQPETDQELFETQQGEVEDLLTAALGLDVQQCYLDVHYRSRNADLIGFSNEHFYGSRLQPIPAHPRNRARFSPITVYRVDGVYDKRRNEAEAHAVVKIVRDLLKRASPPSIGIACFNLVQRDLIVETLEEEAEQDSAFASRLAEARERRGPSSSEGLFVKNLENVQGDERDHIIISTTYGPDPTGKFRRGFGPLGTMGGGRRLNVLVTRSRNEMHLVTSIPKAAYSTLPPVPPGTAPSGAWLLFSYLSYAERLQGDYELNHRVLENTPPVVEPTVVVRGSRTPSAFAKSLAARLAESGTGSQVHWGNEGFCVDLALQHPTRPEDVTIGIQTDMTRFLGSDDPVEWDLFNTQIHESQGWRLYRVWTPHFFRDVTGSMAAMAAEIKRASD